VVLPEFHRWIVATDQSIAAHVEILPVRSTYTANAQSSPTLPLNLLIFSHREASKHVIPSLRYAIVGDLRFSRPDFDLDSRLRNDRAIVPMAKPFGVGSLSCLERWFNICIWKHCYDRK
jgi:hypothetical protein